MSATDFIDLSGVTFTQEISFDFAQAHLRFLAPGARLIRVDRPAAFRFRYGSNLPIAGNYNGTLSNDGELLNALALPPDSATSSP